VLAILAAVSCPRVIALFFAFMRTVLAFQSAREVEIMSALIRASMRFGVLASVTTMFRSRVGALIPAVVSTMVAVDYAPVIRRVRALTRAAMDSLVLALI
jgi:hypothetical protein